MKIASRSKISELEVEEETRKLKISSSDASLLPLLLLAASIPPFTSPPILASSPIAIRAETCWAVRMVAVPTTKGMVALRPSGCCSSA